MAKGQIKQKGGRDTQLNITLTSEERARFNAAADRAGKSKADFLMSLLDAVEVKEGQS